MVCFLSVGGALAVPETVSVRVTDVTTSSFTVVWMTDVAAVPTVEVFTDAEGADPVAGSVTITAMAGTTAEVAAAAKQKGIMQVRIAGLEPGTTYYVKTVTADPANTDSKGYSALEEVRTATLVKPYKSASDGTLKSFSNDLLTFKVYIRAGETGLGDLLVLETSESPKRLSAFAGEGVVGDAEGVLDLNNLFGADLASLDVAGGEKTVLRIYRGLEKLPILLHYRRVPADGNAVNVLEAAAGFFADINLDGNVDALDFAEFRKQYRTVAEGVEFNPDYDFPDKDFVKDGVVDVRDFSGFANEYGRTGVE